MKIANLHLTHLTPSDLISRAYKILTRYGLSTKKMESNLRLYLDILRRHRITPTFPITAKLLCRHPDLIQKFSADNVEFAVHGYNHVDYTKLSPNTFSQHTQKATSIFEKHHIPFSGFRFPYLRYDKKFFNIIENHGFRWDSSQSILWDAFKDLRLKEKNWHGYQTMLSQYDYRNADSYVCLPRFLDNNNILEIPVSIPDDDLLERLGITENHAAGELWKQILRHAHMRGELFALQLHPERIFIFEDALNSIIQTAKALYPPVWVACLGSISDWWKEKSAFTIQLKDKRNFEYEVVADCSPTATLLVKSPDFENHRLIDGYSYVKERTFSIKSPTRPIVGIPKYSSPELMRFLKNEGFIFELSEHKENYSVYLEEFVDFSEENEMEALEIIHSNDLPLVRFWRWPDGCRSALAITGDIDALTSLDFFLRFYGLDS